MKKIRVGIVGTGMAGRFHLECLRRVHGTEVEVTAVTSLRPASREKFGKTHGVPVFPDVPSMLPHVDLLEICSPPYAHQEGIILAAEAGKAVVCEKPLAGYFGDGSAKFRGNKSPKASMLKEVLKRLKTIAAAVRSNKVFFGYAENFVYAPAIQKEREIVEKTGAQILRMTGEESHNGSASPVYGIWKFAGGGSLMGKGCHPLSAQLYLKRVEGIARNGKPIRPAKITARTHEITRLPRYRDLKLIRTDYLDIEDYGWIHVEFDDGTIGDVITSEIVLGGIYDYVEVFANNHRTRCKISPVSLLDTYNPRGEQFKDIYLIEKASTKEGWSPAAGDENFTMGYQAEVQDFITSATLGRAPQSGLDLALDTTATIYAAYLSQERGGKVVDVPTV